MGQQWEYCRLVYQYALTSQMVEGSYQSVWETREASVKFYGLPQPSVRDVKEIGADVAIGRLGAAGWEIFQVFYPIVRQYDPDQVVYHFKRQAQPGRRIDDAF